MKKNIIILLAICLINGCVARNSNQNYVLVAKGSGSSIEIAQSNALSSLSNMIFVNVDSSFSSSDTLNNNKFTTQAINKVNLSSNGYLKGHVFFDQYKETKNVYSVSVGLTAGAIIDNIEFLKSQINVDSYSVVGKYALIVQRDKLNFLLALINYAKANQLYQVDVAEYEELVLALNDLNLKIDASVRLKFVLYPQDISDVKIVLNKKTQKAFTDLYLQSGSYSYSVDAIGYMPQSGVIDLSKGSSIDYTIYMQKKLANKAKFNLVIDNQSSSDTKLLKDFSEKFIAKNQGEVVANAYDYKLLITFNAEYMSELSKNFYIQNIPIVVSIYDINGSLLKEEKFNASYVAPSINKDIAYKEAIKVVETKLNIMLSMLYE